MARKKSESSHENHERWLVSYADFITLMFAFFVVMWASANTNTSKQQQVSESLRKALDDGQIASAIAGILGGTPDDKGKGNALMKGPGGARTGEDEAQRRNVSELLPTLQTLNEKLAEEIQTGKLQVQLTPRGLVVSLRQAAFFPSGDATVDPKIHPTVAKIAETVAAIPNPVRLEGHTDSVPIHNARFSSNWELSAARAISMLELLTAKFGVDRARVAIAGYADNVPVGSNQTEAGRALNRRVDVVILTEKGLLREPQADAAEVSVPRR